MTSDAIASFTTPREGDLGCLSVRNKAGLIASVLPNGSVFAIEHVSERGSIMLNQVPGSPIHGGIARIYLRVGGVSAISSSTARNFSCCPITIR